MNFDFSAFLTSHCAVSVNNDRAFFSLFNTFCLFVPTHPNSISQRKQKTARSNQSPIQMQMKL